MEERFDGPEPYQRIANEALLPAMRLIRTTENPTEKLKDLAEARNIEAFVPLYLGWIRIAGYMHGFEKGEAAWVREHTLYWQVELRYPGLAAAIWAAQGRKAFSGDAIANALANEPDRLRQLHERLGSDESAFVESLLSWSTA